MSSAPHAPAPAVQGPGPALSDEGVRALARLCRLDLTTAEIARITHDLGGILAYVEELRALDVTDVPPMAHVQIERLSLREDVEAPSLPRDVALAGAPSVALDGFAVPAFADEG